MSSYWILLALLPMAARAAVARVEVSPDTALRAGVVIEGRLARPVFNGASEALPAGARVRVMLREVRKPPVRPFIGWLKLAAGAHRGAPAVTLDPVEIEAPGRPPVSMPADFVRLSRERRYEAGAKASGPRKHILVLRFSGEDSDRGSRATDHDLIPNGTRVRIDLTTPLTTARNRTGAPLQARVAEPVLVDGRVAIPEGAVFVGSVAESRRARRPYRAGRMRLSFRTLRFPSGQEVEVAVTPSAGDLSGGVRMETEGGLTSGAWTGRQAVFNAALAYVTGKVLDDAIEESAKGALGAAVAGSAETAARYAGLASGALVFLLHRGREVVLEPETELSLTFTRDLQLP